ncbi:amidase family protein [Microbacterium pseudoresistens]|uniref:Aspartyl-tRNA(Asn)/glutamyl-tRNA(Gln) amidotransferase subunit A n=1 Tax=Microbacterium pseudoresistens TaxID=640634 RepID=A0A7Y9JM34_9MICO|nr:aspartyl-tRNA(Asn)/glutamyl-tRNA(Gln) amidotransferase subunit A [Microbacterium pseudoresistens]
MKNVSASVRGLRDELSRGRTTARQLVERYAARIVDENSRWHCYRETNFDEARRVAATFDRDASSFPHVLSGIPVGIKDVFPLSTVPARSGSAVVPRRDAAESGLSRHLRSMSTPVLGLQTCHEFAYGPLGDVSHPMPAVNPRDPGLVPGGSSSGSAVAVATGLAPLSFGTDTGGSIRTPAAVNALVGFMPAENSVDMSMMSHLSPSLDRVGPIAADVESAYLGWLSLTGGSASLEDLPEIEPVGQRIGVLSGPSFDDLDATVSAGYEAFLSRLGRRRAPGTARLDATPGIDAQGTIVGAEAWRLYADLATDENSRMGKEVAGRIRRGGEISAEEYAHAQQRGREFDAALKQLLDEFDLLICPTTPIAIPRVGQREFLRADGTAESIYRAVTRHTSPFNVSSASALTVPYDTTSANPFSVQIVTKIGAETLAFGLAATIERKYQK